MQASATDESEYSKIGNAIEDFYNGGWSATNAKGSLWTSMFTGIRAANHFLEEFQNLDFEELKANSTYKGELYRYQNYQYEARFLRAYFYFLLVRQYGGVPIMDRQCRQMKLTRFHATHPMKCSNLSLTNVTLLKTI